MFASTEEAVHEVAISDLSDQTRKNYFQLRQIKLCLENDTEY